MDEQLYETLDTRTYEAAERDQMLDDLREQDEHTVVFHFEEPRQLIFNSDGTTAMGGFRFTSSAFMQLCRLLSPGLANLVTDLAGVRRKTEERSGRDWHNMEEALQILNIVLQRRFNETLQGKQALRDTRTGVVEGIVGRNYKRLSNFELFDRAEEVLKSYRQPVEFYRAVVSGRRAVFVYRDEEPLVRAPVPNVEDYHHGGMYYINSEIGDGAVRASIALIRQFDGAMALGSYHFDGGRVSHKGADFRKKFERLLSKVAEHQHDKDRLEDGFTRLVSTSLGFTGEDEHDPEHMEDLARVLHAKKLTQGLAKKVLNNTLMQASTDKHPYEDLNQVAGQVWAQRTAYDLFCSMIRIASNLPLLLKEGLEQLAYGLLVGRSRIPNTRRNV